MGVVTIPWPVIAEFVIPAAILLIAVALGTALETFVRRRVSQNSLVQRHTWLKIALDSVGASIVFWTASFGVYVAIAVAVPSPAVRSLLDQVLLVLVFASITIVVARFVGGAVLQLSHGQGQQIASGTLFASIAQVLVFVMGLLIILSSLGIQITPLLTALGVGGLAVALALQPPLANLFSGLQLVASRQIRPGDYVRLQTGQEGVVEDINWRSISIREPPNNLVVVPNSMLAQAIFTNYRLPEPRVATRVRLRVAYGSDLDFVERLALEAAHSALDDVGAASSARDAYVRFEEFADTTINISVNYFAPRVIEQERSQSAVLRHFYELLQRNGIGSPVQNPVRGREETGSARIGERGVIAPAASSGSEPERRPS